MNKQEEWLGHVLLDNLEMHSFSWTDDSGTPCLWCGKNVDAWMLEDGYALCNCGESDIPDREVLL